MRPSGLVDADFFDAATAFFQQHAVTAVRTANAAVFIERDIAFTAGTFVAHIWGSGWVGN